MHNNNIQHQKKKISSKIQFGHHPVIKTLNGNNLSENKSHLSSVIKQKNMGSNFSFQLSNCSPASKGLVFQNYSFDYTGAASELWLWLAWCVGIMSKLRTFVFMYAERTLT